MRLTATCAILVISIGVGGSSRASLFEESHVELLKEFHVTQLERAGKRLDDVVAELAGFIDSKRHVNRDGPHSFGWALPEFSKHVTGRMSMLPSGYTTVQLMIDIGRGKPLVEAILDRCQPEAAADYLASAFERGGRRLETVTTQVTHLQRKPKYVGPHLQNSSMASREELDLYRAFEAVKGPMKEAANRLAGRLSHLEGMGTRAILANGDTSSVKVHVQRVGDLLLVSYRPPSYSTRERTVGIGDDGPVILCFTPKKKKGGHKFKSLKTLFRVRDLRQR